MAKKPRLAKVETPRGTGTSLTPLSPYQVSINGSNPRAQDPLGGIVLNSPADWFGPLNPMRPIAPPEVAGRRYDYAPGYNLVTQPRSYEVIGFPVMRALAESFDVLRIVIETRKDQLCKMRWKIAVKEDEVPDGGAKKGGKKGKATTDQQSRIDEIEAFLARPDGIHRWRPWLRSLLEDVFVIDAPALYMQRNRGGRLIALKQIDGASVKVLIDDWGRTPMPYWQGGKLIIPAAYQQVLKGFPAVNYSVKDVLYRPYNNRVHKAYGYSPVEQIIITVNIALRRQMFQLAYYTEGNIPEALIGTPDTWTPEQVMAFQTYWDTLLTGNLAQRRHAKFVPGGVAKTFIATKEPDLKNPLDEWLARVVCFAFSISPQPFVQQMNRATAGTAQETAKEEGIEPLKEYIKEMIDDVIVEMDGPDSDLEFVWDEEIEVDQLAQTNIITARSDSGVITINQARADLGLEADPNPAADMLMVKTATGLVPIDANTVEGKKAAIAAGIAADPLAPPALPPGAKGGLPGKPAKGSPDEKPPKGADRSKPSDGGDTSKAFAHSAHAHGTARFQKAAGRRPGPVPFDRPASVKAERRVKKLVFEALRKVAKGVAKQVRADLDKIAKAKKPKDTADEIAQAADLSAIEAIIPDVADEFESVAIDTSTYALAQIGPDATSDLVDQVNEKAVETARQFAAELVGMRYDENGDLVEAARAEYRIDESTRDMIRDTIADGLEENIGTDAIAEAIMDSTGFSEERADLIAHTEIARANSMAAVEGYRGARDDLGVNVKKEWLVSDEPCPICVDNEADGAIDLDDDFSSGDGEPPAHPNCECAISPVVLDGGDESDVEE